MKLFAKTVTGFYILIVFWKISILDIWQGSESTPECSEYVESYQRL